MNQSNLNDSLGVIDCIFTDKTGTLTKNILKFKRFSTKSKMYDDFPNLEMN